jgi:DNA-directed RNA polymerase subunit M/transcription elongation factor TFIIS
MDNEACSGRPERGPSSPVAFEQLACKRCGQAMALVTVISRFDDRPAHRIFRCAACKFIDWVKLNGVTPAACKT